jgi:hypothetical protein
VNSNISNEEAARVDFLCKNVGKPPASKKEPQHQAGQNEIYLPKLSAIQMKENH